MQSDLSQRPRIEDSADEGEDLDDTAHMGADYRPIPELDKYEARYLDDRDQSELSYDGRAAAERTYLLQRRIIAKTYCAKMNGKHVIELSYL